MIECPECKNTIDDKVFYCPICGKKIKEKPVNLDFGRIAWLIFLSAVLPPLNISLTMRYIKSPDVKARQWGWISLGVMCLALGLVTWWGIKWAENVNKQVNQEMDRLLGF